MKSIIKEVNEKSDDIIRENNFLVIGFQKRLSTRIMHIFKKYKIVVNNNIVSKKLEENLSNNMIDINFEVISKYRYMLRKYEEIVQEHVKNKLSTDEIKKSTILFVSKINEKNKLMLNGTIATNFIENMNSIILVYDNAKLNEEVLKRINIDTNEIINEINTNNYNYVIESINMIIKNIISSL